MTFLGECARPQCSEPTGFNAVSQKAGGAAAAPKAGNATAPAQLRLLRKRAADFENTLDVRTELSTMDISEVCASFEE